MQKINFFNKTKTLVLKHKIISSIIILVLLVGGYYGYNFFSKTNTETRYILTSVAKGMITASVSGTGQVESADSRDVKAEASGKITYLNSNAKTGNTITKGTLIASIDNTDALKTVTSKKRAIENAEDNLETAKIALDKLIGSDESNPTVKQDAEKDLTKAYEDGYNAVSSVFLDLPSIMKGLDDILYGNTFISYQDNIDYYTSVASTYDSTADVFKNSAEISYKKARTDYDANFKNYKASNIYSDTEDISSLIVEAYNTTREIVQSVKDAVNLIQFYKDTLTTHRGQTNSVADTHISSLSSYLSIANSDVSSLFSSTSTIDKDVQAITDSTNTIRTSRLDVKSKEQAVEDAKTALEDAQDALSDYYIYANLTGVVSSVDIKSGDDISSGSVVTTIITKSKIAKITLSESDIADIKVGDKAILTFDAIEDLTITGGVIEVDSAGTASSGVVSYGLEIAFDTNSDSVKSGMSASATIITNSKSDVLTIPTTAVKSNNDGTYYVQVLSKAYDLTDKTNSIKGVVSATAPTAKTITIGLSDETNTEITGGLSENDQVVVRISTTTTASSSSSRSSAPPNSILNTNGPGGAGGPPGM